MITVTTSNGKFFLSYFLNLIGNNSQVLDENELQQEDLNYIVTALSSGRIQLAEGDLERINTKLSLNEVGSSGLLSNTTNSLLPSSSSTYPTTEAVDVFVTERLSLKVDKETGKGLSTNDFTNEYKTKLDSLSNIEIIQLTQSAYEALSYEDRTKPNTLYLIIG